MKETAKEALADTARLVDLYNHYRHLMAQQKRVPSACAGVLDALFAAPMLSIAHHAEQHQESFQNVAKAVEFWQKHGLVKVATNQKRNRIFVAPPVLEVTRPRPAPSPS